MSEQSNAPQKQGLHMDQVVAFFRKLDDAGKKEFFRRVEVIPFFHRDHKRGRDIYPSNAMVLGRAIPAMSLLMSAQQRAYDFLAQRRIDIGNPAIYTALAESTYFRPRDENDNPIGEEPGIIEDMIMKLNEHRNDVFEACNKAWIKPAFNSRRSRPTAPHDTAKAEPKAESKAKEQKTKGAEKKTPAKDKAAQKKATPQASEKKGTDKASGKADAAPKVEAKAKDEVKPEKVETKSETKVDTPQETPAAEAAV